MNRDRPNDRRGVTFTRDSAKEIADVVRAVRGARRGVAASALPTDSHGSGSYSWAWVFNSLATGVVPKYGVMELAGLQNMADGQKLFSEQAIDTPAPVFRGIAPWSDGVNEMQLIPGRRRLYGVALHEIEPQTIGRVAVSGIVPARVKNNGGDARLAGPCVSIANPAGRYAAIEQFETGWGNVEVVDFLSPYEPGYETPTCLVRLGVAPFRCYAVADASVGTNVASAARVRVGQYLAERDLTTSSGTSIRVLYRSVYGAVDQGARMILEDGMDGDFVPLVVERLSPNLRLQDIQSAIYENAGLATAIRWAVNHPNG